MNNGHHYILIELFDIVKNGGQGLIEKYWQYCRLKLVEVEASKLPHVVFLLTWPITKAYQPNRNLSLELAPPWLHESCVLPEHSLGKAFHLQVLWRMKLLLLRCLLPPTTANDWKLNKLKDKFDRLNNQQTKSYYIICYVTGQKVITWHTMSAQEFMQ